MNQSRAQKHRHRWPIALLVLLGSTSILSSQGREAAAQDGAPVTIDASAILGRVEPILQRIVDIRGIEPVAPIPAGIHDRERLREIILRKTDEEVSAERWRIEQALLERLGVLDPGTDYRDMMMELLTSQIAGFYDDETKELFLIDDLPTALLEATMAHELFHGIQDQRWGIGNLTAAWDTADDVILATMALIEGDALGVMIDYSLGGLIRFTDIPGFEELLGQQLGSFDLMAVSDLPEGVGRFVTDTMLFPYLQGLVFVHRLVSHGGWAAVDRAYLAPPLSTEQVLHPEAYLDEDRPTWVDLDLAPLEEQSYRSSYSQVMGEFGWKALFADVLEGLAAERSIEAATTGWDGDRLIALEGGDGDLVIIALTVWDSPSDAREFYTLLRQATEVNHRSAIPEVFKGLHGMRSALSLERRWTVIEQWGDMVLYLDGAPDRLTGHQAEPWIEIIWRGRSRSVYPEPSSDRAR